MSVYDDGLLADAREIVNQIFLTLRPPPRLTLSEWADRHYRLSADAGAAEPGPWRTYPYQRDIMDAMTDPLVESVTIAKSSRVGYTEIIKALVAYHVEHDPCPILLVQPTEKDAKGFSKENIDPLIRDIPIVGERFRKPRGERDAMLLRRFKGGVLQIVGANSPGNFRRVSRRLILSDELDGYAQSAGKEGDPLQLAEKRSESFWNRKHVRGSSLTDKGVSRTERLFFEGDQRRRYLPCPECGELQVLKFENLKWDDRPPEEAMFVCIFCGVYIDRARYPWMDEHGEWRPGPHAQFPNDPPPGTDPRHRSYHVWSSYSYLPNATWGHIAAAFVKAKAAGLDSFKTFVNTWLGETWADAGDAPEWRLLYDRREPYAIGTCPAGVRFLTCGVDVQRDGFFYEVVGWGRNKESWSIDANFIEGDPSDRTTTGPWSQLDALLDRSFTHDGGAEIRIARLAIDAGDQTQSVYDWVRTKKGRGVMAIKGIDSASTLVSTPSKVDVTIDGKRVGHVRLWRVGKQIGIKEWYGWLRQLLPTEREREAGAQPPPGYCHFPGHGERFFQQVTALQIVTRKNRQGFQIHEWMVIPGRDDHYLSARRYARAAAWVFGLDRFKDVEWEALEAALGKLARQQVEIATRAAADADHQPPTTTSPADAGPDQTPSPSPPAPVPRRSPRPRRRPPSHSKYLGRG